jgi:hypothetical protein
VDGFSAIGAAFPADGLVGAGSLFSEQPASATDRTTPSKRYLIASLQVNGNGQPQKSFQTGGSRRLTGSHFKLFTREVTRGHFTGKHQPIRWQEQMRRERVAERSRGKRERDDHEPSRSIRRVLIPEIIAARNGIRVMPEQETYAATGRYM